MGVIEKLGISKWSVWNHEDRTFILDQNDDQICETNNTTDIEDALIASAPEMLEALIELQQFYTNTTGLPAVKANTIYKRIGTSVSEIKELL